MREEIAKNYLTERELQVLHRIVNLYIEFAELPMINPSSDRQNSRRQPRERPAEVIVADHSAANRHCSAAASYHGTSWR